MADFDVSKPSIARVYDFLLGGKDNFAADRALGERAISMAPELVAMVRENREMLTRAVSWAGAQGIAQFIDLGCGLPTEPATHVTARAAVPGAKVAYADNDPVVINHLTALLGKDPAVAVIDGDVADSAAVLAGASRVIDLARPACLLLGALVHFYKPEAVSAMVAAYASALAVGSYVVLSAARVQPGPEGDQLMGMYSAESHEFCNHSAADLASFLDGLEVLPPGVADARVWRPGWESVPDAAPRGVSIVGVMARKTA